MRQVQKNNVKIIPADFFDRFPAVITDIDVLQSMPFQYSFDRREGHLFVINNQYFHNCCLPNRG